MWVLTARLLKMPKMWGRNQMVNQQRRGKGRVGCRNSEITFVSGSRKLGPVVIGHKSAVLGEAARGADVPRLAWVAE